MSDYIDSTSNLLLGQNETCFRMVSFLKNHLNNAYVKARESNPALPDGIVVRSTRNYDAINIPLSEFPVLKVFRNSDTYRVGTTTSNTIGSITYNVSYPQLDALPDLLYWVSDMLNYGLLEYKRTINHQLPSKQQSPYRTEYLLTFNEQQQVAFPFLRMSLDFIDFADPCTSLLPYL